ncbi:hypothetical protein ACHAQA_009748 [Verticillium albo-atrum]
MVALSGQGPANAEPPSKPDVASLVRSLGFSQPSLVQPPAHRQPPDPPGSRDPSTSRLAKSEIGSRPSAEDSSPATGPNVDQLRFFRRALGIHSGAALSNNDDLERSRAASSTGLYASILREHAVKKWQRRILTVIIYACHIAQVVIGAVLTALGPSSAIHAVSITILGATNTTVAGIMALVKGQGLMEKLRNEELEMLQLKGWVEETEALIEAGIVGGDHEDASRLVAEGYRRYRAVMTEGKPRDGLGLRLDEDERSNGLWRQRWDNTVGKLQRR